MLKAALSSGHRTQPRTRRTVALPATLAEHVREQHLDPGDKRALVFTAPGGGPIRYANWRNRVWVPACEAADRRWHRARIGDVGKMTEPQLNVRGPSTREYRWR